MEKLKLPEFDFKIEGDKIHCIVRKKWVVLTPEEWVRQHFLSLLIHHLHYPKGMMRLEHTLFYFKQQKRSDITVLNGDGTVYLVVECKAPNVNLSERTVEQLATYNKVLDAEYLAITNGMRHYFWVKEAKGFVQLKTYPSAPGN